MKVNVYELPIMAASNATFFWGGEKKKKRMAIVSLALQNNSALHTELVFVCLFSAVVGFFNFNFYFRMHLYY